MGANRIVVVGGGASGMAAAIAAAQSGAHVCVVEAAAKLGRSVMASGNGRCNFANADLDPGRYNDPAFVARAMGDAPLAQILDFFEHLGLWYVSDGEGRLYPRSRAAASVLDVLLAGLRERAVEVRLSSRAVGLSRRGGSCGSADRGTGGRAAWEVELEDGSVLEADAVVWAAGGGSAEVPAACLGLPCVPERPVLCPLATEPRPGKVLDGVRVTCAVELRSGGGVLAREDGEVLMRPYGLSGIAVFDLSRLAEPGDTVALDLMPDVSERDLADALAQRAVMLRSRLERGEGAGGCADAFLDGALHPRLARHIMGLPGVARGAEVDCAHLASVLKGLAFTVRGTADEDHAQVVRGGLDNGGFDPLTLEARGVAGFFACGEALDVDGACGGFNLAWAWTSGMVAGVAAARRTR